VARRSPAAGAATEPENSRGAILQAAAHTIARHGVRGLKVDEVAAAAGVSTPLLYYHFESRAGLVKATLGYASVEAPSSALPEGPPEGDTGYEALERALLAELDDSEQVRDNAVVWGEVAASAVFEDALRPDVKDAVETWHDEVAQGIRAGLADGSIRAGIDPAETAELVTTLVDGLCTRWLSGSITAERARELLAADLRHRLRA
jgi:AcrR family transcriptional regulator